MGYFHAMSSQTEGITATAPVRWRSFDTMMGVFWEAEGSSGATGYYRSSDPRIVLFFNDVSDHILLTENGQRIDISSRPMLRAIYVPAGIPIWTRFSADHQFTHLDVHLSKSWLVEKLAPVLGHAGALSALARPAETQNVGEIGAIGNALKQEILASKHHPLYAESLAVAIVVGLIDPPCSPERSEANSGGLTPVQMRKLQSVLQAYKNERVTNAILAESIGLSPNWFSHAFKKTTGKTPLQWQQERRIAMVKQALLYGDKNIAQVAMTFGFSDQAHLTKAFRRHEGITPAAWLRENRTPKPSPQ